MPEAAVLSFRFGKRLDFMPLRPHHALHDHLGNALAAFDDDRLGAQINRDHMNFTAKIRVDGSRTVYQGKSLLERKPAARPDLRFETRWHSDSDSGGNQRPFHRRKLPIVFDIGAKIHPGRTLGHVDRQGKRIWTRPQALDFNANFFHR